MKTLRPYLIFALIAAALWGMNYSFEEYMNPYILRVVINCGIAIIMAMSLNLVNGCAGQFSLGHAGFMAVGAYISATLTTILSLGSFFQSDLGVGVAILAGGLCAALAGYLVGLPSLRLKGDYLAIVTLGFGEIIRILLINIEVVGGPRGLPAIPRASNFFWVFIWVVLTFFCLLRLIRSSPGRAILSVRENEIAAESMGINITRHKIVAFVISSFFAGIAGGLFAHYQGFIDPGKFDFNESVKAVIMVVIGGMGSLSGAVMGGIIVSILPEVLRVFNQYRMVIFPLILVILMLVRPTGIMGHHEIWEIFGKKKGRTPRKGALKSAVTTS